jgi:threonine dehydratase
VSLPVTLKLELLQHSGSLAGAARSTIRPGALSVQACCQYLRRQSWCGCRYVCQQLGHAAKFFVPEISSPAKVARIASYGADIAQKGANYNEALGFCDAYIAGSGAIGVHAYDSQATLEGQGTLGRELEDQAPALVRACRRLAAAA